MSGPQPLQRAEEESARTSYRALCLDPDKGRRLARLVTKFETLAAVSSMDGSAAFNTTGSLPPPGGNEIAGHGNSKSGASSKSTASLSSVITHEQAASTDKPQKHLPSPPILRSSPPVQSSAPAIRPVSMVAERRRFFEGSSSHDSSGALPSSSPVSYPSSVETADLICSPTKVCLGAQTGRRQQQEWPADL